MGEETAVFDEPAAQGPAEVEGEGAECQDQRAHGAGKQPRLRSCPDGLETGRTHAELAEEGGDREHADSR